MTAFIIGAISGSIGCTIGLAIAACCVVAGREDESIGDGNIWEPGVYGWEVAT